MSDATIPVIGVSACNAPLGLQTFNIVGEKYLLGVINGTGGWPLIIPSVGEGIPMSVILERLDGILFTGSPSNVEPHHYAGLRASRVLTTILVVTPPRCH